MSPPPQWVRPQLTQLVDGAPDGDQWLDEIKYDGYRMHARLDRDAVKVLTRTRLDWTHKYPAIAKAIAALDARPLISTKTVFSAQADDTGATYVGGIADAVVYQPTGAIDLVVDWKTDVSPSAGQIEL